MANIAAIDTSLGDAQTINNILDSMIVERQRLSDAEPDARENLISQARDLIASLETPLESILWMIWAEPTRTFAARIALDLDLFQVLCEGGEPKSAVQIAESTNASPVLVNRIARKLASMRMLNETGPGEYAPNSLTRVLTMARYSDGIRFCYDAAGPSFVQMSQYFEHKGVLENPQDPLDGPFQFAQRSPNVFAWLNEHPKILHAFHAYVHGQREDRPSWQDFYPVKERLIDGLKLKGDSSAIVDVGGGAGHVLDEFRVQVPEFKGRLVVQEQQAVVDHARAMGVHERIELQVHDFFNEHPIKGARAYYLRYVLHDWTDDLCRKILGRLKDAMEPGYSRILINDCVVADQGAAWQHSSLDLFMMALTSSYERTESEWTGLVASAGLTLGGIYSQGKGNESLIEVLLL